jgi:FKBP-type peptidyl-prolyl cis-trans isomerase SlyD
LFKIFRRCFGYKSSSRELQLYSLLSIFKTNIYESNEKQVFFAAQFNKHNMEIARNKFVTLSYELRLNDAAGELVEKTDANNPLAFLFGAGKMLQMFEDKLEGLKTGEEFKFELKPEEAYGEVNPQAIVDLPKNIFEVNGTIDESLLTPGNQVPMQDAQGNRLNGIVLEVTDDIVKMDFNHPLAGDTLFFSGSVLEVREATEDEIAEAAGLHETCSTHDGGCSTCGTGC